MIKIELETTPNFFDKNCVVRPSDWQLSKGNNFTFIHNKKELLQLYDGLADILQQHFQTCYKYIF